MITQRLRPRLALTLLCTLLLVNDGFSGSARAQARALEEDPLLPPVVPIESATSKSGSSGERDPLVPAAAAATTVASYPAGDKPLEAAVSNSNNNSLSPQTNAVEASKSPPDAASQSSEDSNITRKQEDTSKTGESASKPADVPQAAPPAEGLVPSEPAKAAAAEVPAPATTAQEKDLKSLLENKNDAENDLASSPTGATGSAPDSAANANRKSPVDDVPVSVVAESDKPNSNNDRFHYSLGAVDSADKQQPAGEKAPDSPAAASPKDKDKEEGSDKEEDTREPEAQDEPDEETDKRKETPEKKDAAADEEQAAAATTTTNTTPKPEQPAESSTSVTKESPVSPAAAPKQSVAEDKGASAEPVTTAASSSPVGGEASSSEASKPAKEEASAGAEAAAADKPLAKPADAGAADDTKIVTDQPSKSPDSATAAVATAEQPGSRSDASTTTTTTTTTTPGPSTSASSAVVAKSDEPKPPIEEAPQQKPAASAKPEPVEAASAAAAAAGAVAGSALANGLSGKDKPVVASPAAAAAPAPASKAVTTAAPSSEEPSSPSSPSTTRKSSTNRWNTWSTSTTSSTPPPSTRRRPILPSIRRRFRPYNVFPWAMPESYSPLEPVAPADTEPMFGRPNIDSVPSSVSSPKPKRRGGSTSTTTTVEPSPSSSASTSRPTSSSTTTSKPERDDESDADTPTYSSRRKVPSESSGSGVGGSTKRRHHHHHHHRHHNTHKGGHHYHSTTNRFSPENAGGELPSWGSGSDSFESQMPPKRRFDSHAGERPHRPSSSHHHGGSRPWHSSHGARRTNKHNDDPFTSFSPSGPTGPLDPSFSPNRPQSGFGLFNSPSGGSPSSTAGSGFDLLNPFSWIDEVTKPRPRPSLSSSPVGGGRDHHSSFRPSHMGPAGAARPLSGQRPHAYEGEFSESAGGSGGLGPSHHHGDIDRPLSAHDETYNHHHDHHNTHRPHGGSGLGRPLVGGGSIGHGRDDYDDYHDCHGHDHDRDRDRDHDHDHHGRPYPRPPYRPTRPGRDDYDDAGPVYGSRPGGRPIGGRPYSRRDENASEGAGGATGPALESETPVLRNRESTRSASPGERLESGSSSASGGSDSSSASGPAAGPRRVPSSVFSPFDTLFGSLDDDLFGGLRSSFIDTPLKAAAETIRQTNNAAFDAIISSPKISLPPSGGDQSSSAAAAGQAGGNLHKQHQTVSEPHSARVIMARVESNEPAIQSTDPLSLVPFGPF